MAVELAGGSYRRSKDRQKLAVTNWLLSGCLRDHGASRSGRFQRHHLEKFAATARGRDRRCAWPWAAYGREARHNTQDEDARDQSEMAGVLETHQRPLWIARWHFRCALPGGHGLLLAERFCDRGGIELASMPAQTATGGCRRGRAQCKKAEEVKRSSWLPRSFVLPP